MASLQARHSRSCKLYPWAPFARSTKADGCTCKPLYHVVHRHEGKLVRDPVGHDRKNAERALNKREVQIDEREYRTIKDIRFWEWANEWLTGLTAKDNTRRVYEDSLDYAKETFGTKKVRDLDPGDIRRYLDLIRASTLERRNRGRKPGDPPAAPASPATLAKHLRQLGACLQAAEQEGYASDNPVRRLPKGFRPKVEKPTPVYYTDAELARLWPELAERPVMLAFGKLAVGTGLRIGELAALRWSDVDLLNRELHVRRTYVEGIGEQTPKSGQGRVIHLTPPAAKVLEDWFALSGGEGLVFEREEAGYLYSGYVTRSVLYPALERAGIPREGEGGRNRDFHSFRHTFARLALEGGAPITWVQQQLGHSSITLTVDTYGHWSQEAQRQQAEKLAEAFAL